MKISVIPCTVGISNPEVDKWKNAPQGLSSIHMPLQGKLFCHSSAGTKELTPGNIYFMANRTSLQFELGEDMQYQHLFLNFRALPPLLSHDVLCVEGESDAYLLHLTKAAEAIIRESLDATGQNKFSGTNDPVWQRVRPILELLVQHFQHRYGITTIDNPKLLTAVRYIEDHFHEPLQNKDIAAELHIDSRYLIRLFKKNMDISPHEYLTQCRIDHAMSLLRENTPIAEIAERCGFQSENAFRIAFKKYTGVPPTRFLKNN